MNRLWVRLTLLFAAVILLTVGAVALLAQQTVSRQFLDYLTQINSSDQQALAAKLAEQYAAHGSWQGVPQAILQEPPGTLIAGDVPFPPAPGVAPSRFLVANADGVVIYGGPGGRAGRALSTWEQTSAVPIEVNHTVVGLLVTVPMQFSMLGPEEARFVSQLGRWLLIAALLAGALALVASLALSRSLTAPLTRLAAAARAVADRDFSRRVKAEGSAELTEVAHAFNDMASALEESEQQRQGQVADVAHELRTPLSVLQGSLRAILDDVYPLDKAEIARLYDETRLLSRLVDDLRDLALADAGQLRLDVKPADLGRSVQSMVDSLALAAEAQDVSLGYGPAACEGAVYKETPLLALVDRDRMAQVLRNLLLNALRHTPAGGTVAVSLARGTGEAEVVVADTGEGISPENLPHIFDRFWRADPSRSRGEGSTGGTGLGLSVARILVEAMGGRILVESQVGHGSRFHFTVPLAAQGES
jgi:two-component system OmpR family sensor kinase